MKRVFQISGKQYFDEYILVAPGSDYGHAMWSDIGKIGNGRILNNPLAQTNKALAFFHHIHFSFVINRKIQLPFQYIWKKLYSLEREKLDDSKQFCIIFTDVSAARTDRKYLAELGEKKNITLVLVMVNTMARRGSLIEKRKGYFSQIYSFDKNDCEKYGFIYHPTNYSMMGISSTNVPAIDAFYVGVSKGRADLIGAVYKRLRKAGAKTDFFVSGIEKKVKRIEGIYYNEWLSYGEVLNHIQNTNCIVEIMDGNQEGVTLRTMEAVCYNKKLLTNNASLKKTKYYSTGFIQVFSNLEEIDAEFVKRREAVDYKYDGEFSPVHLLEHINREVGNRNGYAAN